VTPKLIPSFNIHRQSIFLVCQLPWDQTQNYIRSGHRNPEDFDPETLKTITLSEEEGIQAIIAKPWNKQSTEVISYLFSKEKNWTIEKAQEWFREHEKKAKESFSWSGSIKNIPETRNLIRGKALHPIRTVHPQEWPEIRKYLEEELKKSAHTLEGTPLILDHYKPIIGKVLGAEYEDGAIEYVAQLDDPTLTRQIVDGEIKHCSVEFEWKTLEKLNGVAPRGIKFTGLSLLKDYSPGDPQTTVEVWETLLHRMDRPNQRHTRHLRAITRKTRKPPPHGAPIHENQRLDTRQNGGVAQQSPPIRPDPNRTASHVRSSKSPKNRDPKTFGRSNYRFF